MDRLIIRLHCIFGKKYIGIFNVFMYFLFATVVACYVSYIHGITINPFFPRELSFLCLFFVTINIAVNSGLFISGMFFYFWSGIFHG